MDVGGSIVRAGVSALKDSSHFFAGMTEPEEIVSALQAYQGSKKLDRRLNSALKLLAEAPGEYRLPKIAQLCGLSESRLRTIAHDQLGVSLATWAVWRKLERSVRALVDGMTLVDASNAGGFADQAHFTREMRRLFGITPSSALTLKMKPQ